MTPLLDIRDLSVSFRTRAGLVPTLDKVSLQLGRGEILGLVGESGAGKSLTGLALTGLLPPNAVVTAGSVRFDGQEVLGLSEAALRRIRGRRIGMVFQDPMTALDPLMRIGEQLVETIRHHLRLSRGAALDRALRILETAPEHGELVKALEHLANRQQRLGNREAHRNKLLSRAELVALRCEERRKTINLE